MDTLPGYVLVTATHYARARRIPVVCVVKNAGSYDCINPRELDAVLARMHEFAGENYTVPAIWYVTAGGLASDTLPE